MLGFSTRFIKFIKIRIKSNSINFIISHAIFDASTALTTYWRNQKIIDKK